MRLAPKLYDLAVVGGGPAGAMTAWSLAKRGARVIVLDREEFPREKVCGDFIDPRGLRLIENMLGKAALLDTSPLPITHIAIVVDASMAYRDAIPFYGPGTGLPPHGYIVRRKQLDTRLLDAARKAGAILQEGCAVTGFSYERRHIQLQIGHGKRGRAIRARMIVGADGASSLVARQAGLISDDPRYTAVSQRAYAENVRLDRGEAAIVFDTDLFPGYGWMFPMAGGTANIGVGILSEARDRYSISVTALFRAFIDKLRHRHPGCADIQLAGKPLGGIVKTYGGAGRNYFDRGVLVGDAGCFVDPMTGEGITPALESALIASSTLAEALQSGKTEARHLASFERDFRKYFDPAMRYLDLCAAIMRNRHMRHFWLRVALNGYRDAATDPSYASVTGATFGGLDIRPAAIFTQIWTKMLQDLGAGNVRSFCDLLGGRIPARAEWAASLSLLSSGWLHSFLADPLWHSVWAADVLAKWATVCQSFNNSPDPRFSGPALA